MPTTGLFGDTTLFDPVIFDTKNQYVGEISETVTLSESLVRKFSSKRTITEPETSGIFDSVIFGDANLFHLSSTTTTVNDSITGIHGIVRGISETAIIISEVIARFVAFKRTLTETINVDSSITRLQNHVREILEPFRQMFDDALFGDSSLFDVSTQTTGASDSINRTTGKVRILTETITNNDTIARLLTSFRTLSETVTNSETIARILASFRTISDTSISISDDIARQFGVFRAISNTVTNSDSVERLVSYFRTLTETVTNSETLERIRSINRTISESAISISDGVQRIWTQNRVILETVTISELLERVKARTRSAFAYLARHTAKFKITSRDANSYLLKRSNSDGDLT